MKQCLICQKEIDEDEKVCDSCIAFFKGKYKKDYCKKIKRFLNLLKKTHSLESIKFNRRYKNE